MKNYYDILEIDKSASKEEIKKAFHKLAQRYHPDRKGGDEQKFKEVNEAYQILSNDKKRAEYDSYGRVFDDADRQGFSGFQGFGNWDFSDLGGFGNLNDIFSDFFTGSGFRSAGRQKTRRGRDISTELQIPFIDAVFGTERKILIAKTSICQICQGGGAKAEAGLEKCQTCNGQGKLHETKKSFLGSFTAVRTCEECFGSGQVAREKCPTCRGKGVSRKEEEITIKIPAGIREGEIIRLSGMGEAVSRGDSGDLYVKINIAPHPVFRREENDLVMNLSVKLSEALLGGERMVNTLDGEVKIKIPAGISPNEILRLKDKGVPISGSRRGNLLMKLQIKFPTRLSAAARKLIEQLKSEGV